MSVLPEPVDTARIREDLCRVGRSLFERGYVHGTTGNISVRLGHGSGFLITPTDACLGFLEPEKLAWVDEQGEQRSGERASKTLSLHRQIYQHAPEAHCVIHTHSSYLVELTLRGVWHKDDIVPPLTPYYVMKVGHVPLVPYSRPGALQVAEQVAHLIEAYRSRGLALRAVMCERLGPQVWGPNLIATMAVLEELEETARLWLRSLRSGQPLQPLSEVAIEELRQHFKASW